MRWHLALARALEQRGWMCDYEDMLLHSTPNSNLTAHQWATLEGPDAQDFLHRVTTAHTKSLAIGQGLDACLLTAQGKIRSFFSIWRLGEKKFGLKWSKGLPVLEPLDSMTFGESFTVKNWSEDKCEFGWLDLFPSALSELTEADSGTFGTAPLLTSEGTCEARGELQLLRHFDRSYGRPWVSVGGPREKLLSLQKAWIESHGCQEVSSEEMEAWRIQRLTPTFPQEVHTDINPLEVSLGYSIAENKGCYPGQEVVERIRSMGAPPRKLVLVQFQHDPSHPKKPTPFKILGRESGIEIGQVTSIRYTEGQAAFGLAIVRKGQSQIGLKVSSVEETGIRGIEGEIVGEGEKT